MPHRAIVLKEPSNHQRSFEEDHMQRRQKLHSVAAILLAMSMLLASCGVNEAAQVAPASPTARPGSQGVAPAATAKPSQPAVVPAATAKPSEQGVILPTPPPMPESGPLPPTPTIPPAPPSNIAPAAQPLLSTDFSSPAAITSWQVVDGYAAVPGPSIWQVSDGRLQQVSDSDGAPGQYPTALIAGALPSSDYQVSVSAFNIANDEIGLVFRANSQGYYLFRVLPTSGAARYSIARFDTATTTFETLAKADGAGFSFNKWEQLSVSVQGNRIQAFFNGAPVLATSDSTFAQGSVGVYGYAQGQLAFDNLSVTPLGNQ
jgi:3-keto-disaccharide hydrolase